MAFSEPKSICQESVFIFVGGQRYVSVPSGITGIPLIGIYGLPQRPGGDATDAGDGAISAPVASITCSLLILRYPSEVSEGRMRTYCAAIVALLAGQGNARVCIHALFGTVTLPTIFDAESSACTTHPVI